MSFRESDVVFMYPVRDPAVYKAYGATALAWGGELDRRHVEHLHALGIHAAANMWCLTAGWLLRNRPDLNEAVIRDITGEPVEVPWLPEGRANGWPNWWGCFHHPAFREHLHEQVRAVMAGGADGLQVDDHLGTAHPALDYGGCFCDYCMADFRRHLLGPGAESARRAGVAVPEDFDYRDLVRRHAATREDYLRVRKSIPLYRAYVDFQLAAAAENTAALHRTAAEAAVGRPLTRSANTALPQPPHLRVAGELDRLVGEVEWHAPEGLARSGNAVVACRLADALGKPLAATANGSDWAWIKARGASDLVCYWIAQLYAGGHRLMTPARAWCYTPGKGTDYYHGPTADYAPFYRFIRQTAGLLDGYRPAPAALLALFSPSRDHHGDGRLLSLLKELADCGVPFDLAFLPNAWDVGPVPDLPARARRYRHVLLDLRDDPLEPEAAAEAARAVAASHPDVVACPAPGSPEAETLLAASARFRPDDWRVDNPDVWAFPRIRPGSPLVVHLLNRRYDAGRQAFSPVREAVVEVEAALAGGARRVRLFHPEGEPVELPVTETARGLRVVVPELRLWAVLAWEP